MPIKKRVPKVLAHRVTPAAIEAFKAGENMALHRALGLTSSHVSPLDVEEGISCPWPAGTLGAETWPFALELRRQLQKAAKAK